MFYREVRPVQDRMLPPMMAMFPILPGPDRPRRSSSLSASFVVPLLGSSPSSLDVIIGPAAHPVARRRRAEPPHRLYGAAVARDRRLHGRRRLRLLQAHHDYFPRRQYPRAIICSGLFSAAGGAVRAPVSLRIKGFYLAVATLAAQFFLPWCSSASPGSQLQRLGLDRGAAPHRLRHCRSPAPNASPSHAITSPSGIVVVMTLVASNLMPRPHRADLDGSARHGHRRRADRDSAPPRPSFSPLRSPLSIAAWRAR